MKLRNVLLLCGVAGAILAAESGNDLFQKGLAKERAEGDLRGAIQLYQRAASLPGVERKLAAEALFRIAECQQALGSAEARKTYQQIIQDFGDQRDIAVRAGIRLAALKPAATRNSTELSTRRVWVPPATIFFGGSLSPDGRFFSYADGELTVRDMLTGETRQVTHNRSSRSSLGSASSSVISSDQTKIAFAWNAADRRELRVIDWRGTNQKTLYANPEGYAFPDDWSSDGREILVTISTGHGRTRQLAWIPATGGIPRVLKTFPWQSLGSIKAVSPDGRFIAYDSLTGNGGNRAISLLTSDGSAETTLTDGFAKDEVFGWTPDGKALLFATDRSGARELWAVPIEAGKPKGKPFVIKPDLGQIIPLGMSKDGTLLYSRRLTEGQVYTASIDWRSGKMSSLVSIARGVVPEGGADWSPDGKQIAYIAHRGSEPNDAFIVVHSLETGKHREIRPKQQLRILNGYSWSPDGDAYLVTGNDAKQRNGAYSIDLTTGEVRALVQRDGTVQQPQWFPDRKQILYVQPQRLSAAARVFIRNLETGVDREVALGIPGLQRVAVVISPDGQQIAFSPSIDGIHHNSLYVTPLSSSTPRLLYKFGADDSVIVQSWSPDSQRIMLARFNRKGHSQEWSHSWISAVGGEPQGIETSLERLRFHPDGKQVVSVKRETGMELWTLRNLSEALRSSR